MKDDPERRPSRERIVVGAQKTGRVIALRVTGLGAVLVSVKDNDLWLSTATDREIKQKGA